MPIAGGARLHAIEKTRRQKRSALSAIKTTVADAMKERSLMMGGTGGLSEFWRSLLDWMGVVRREDPRGVVCNVCGWEGETLDSDAWHPHSVCPQCRSRVRHRLLLAAVSTLDNVGTDSLVRGKRVLHFAPEPRLAAFLKQHGSQYVTADLMGKHVDLRLDMCNMVDVADASFDLLVACDVLEHVPDDSAALREIHRVLARDGWAILTVPQKDHLPTKYEDPAMVTPEQRKAAFGQEDHLRIYGDDFGRFLEAHGFAVTVVDEHSFDPKLARRHVLFPPVLSDHPLATNHRKVYFARKRSA